MATKPQTAPAFYTVVQYVPNPLADDRMSVGVIVFGDGQIRSRFVQNWKPVQQFAGTDIELLREFAARIDEEAVASAGGPLQPDMFTAGPSRRIDESRILQMASEWSNSIQLTPAEPSLRSHDELLTTLADMVLREPKHTSHRFRDRQQAARMAVNTVRQAVERRVGSKVANKAIGVRYPVAGHLVKNIKVDLAIKNGRVYEVAQAVSFETHNMAELETQSAAAVYSLSDIHQRNRDILLTVVAYPPRPQLKGYSEARQRFTDFRSSLEQIDVRLVRDEETIVWAEEVATLVEREIAKGTSVSR